jgi:hypothetical protein
MTGRFFALTALLVGCLFNCQAQQQTTAPPEEVRNGAITGRVFNDNGQPLAGATVSVRSASVMALTNRTAQTNSEGSFQILGLDSGLYYVSAFSPAYVVPPLDPDDLPPTYRVGDSVRLELVKGGVITGTVTNANNEPLVGVRVRALMVKDAAGKEVKGRFGGNERQTDDRGIYRLFGLSPGTYVVFCGGSGIQSNLLSATDLDAPTYAPSSTRDTASEVQVRSGDEISVDIRYRYEQGHVISGTVKSMGTGGVSLTLSQATGSLSMISSSFQPAGSKGFAFNGIADGEYIVTATESMSLTNNAFPELATSDPLRVTVKGGDVGGLELVLKPLASIAGKITLESVKIPECENKRQPTFAETMISLIQNRKDPELDQIALIRAAVGATMPDKEGTFFIRNLRAGQYALSPRFFARYWYLKSISVPGLTQPQPAKAPAGPRDAAKSWTSVKSADRLTGVTITLSAGAASIRGKLEKNEAGRRVYVVPSERDKVDDPLRYFSAEVNNDGTFLLNSLPPGKYFTVALQAQPDIPATTEKLRLPDALEARSKLRRVAEAAKSEIELKPCQNLPDLTLRLN